MKLVSYICQDMSSICQTQYMQNQKTNNRRAG